MASPSTVRTMYLMKVQRNVRKLAHIDDLWDMRSHKYLEGSSSPSPVTLNVVCSLRGKVAQCNKPAESCNKHFLLIIILFRDLILILKEAVRISNFVQPIDTIVKIFITAYTSFFYLFSKAVMTVITVVMAVNTTVIVVLQR
jgi:hypothetical protein